MEVVTTFCDNVTGNEIYDIMCDCRDAETVYQPGNELIIKGTSYIVERTARCVNGTIQYKVFVKEKE